MTRLDDAVVAVGNCTHVRDRAGARETALGVVVVAVALRLGLPVSGGRALREVALVA